MKRHFSRESDSIRSRSKRCLRGGRIEAGENLGAGHPGPHRPFRLGHARQAHGPQDPPARRQLPDPVRPGHQGRRPRHLPGADPELAPGVPYDQATDPAHHGEPHQRGRRQRGRRPARPQEKQFIIELPDVKNKNAILEQLGTTAQMTFYYFPDVRSETARRASYPLQRSAWTADGQRAVSFSSASPGTASTPARRSATARRSRPTGRAADRGDGTTGPARRRQPYAPPPPNPAQKQVLGAQYDQLTSDTPVYFTPPSSSGRQR